jgi:pilus assembly protein Flp/PilA
MFPANCDPAIDPTQAWRKSTGLSPGVSQSGPKLSRKTGQEDLMHAFVLKLFRDKAGATAIEYALMASLIACAIIAAVSLLGANTLGMYQNIVSGTK